MPVPRPRPLLSRCGYRQLPGHSTFPRSPIVDSLSHRVSYQRHTFRHPMAPASSFSGSPTTHGIGLIGLCPRSISDDICRLDLRARHRTPPMAAAPHGPAIGRRPLLTHGAWNPVFRSFLHFCHFEDCLLRADLSQYASSRVTEPAPGMPHATDASSRVTEPAPGTLARFLAPQHTLVDRHNTTLAFILTFVDRHNTTLAIAPPIRRPFQHQIRRLGRERTLGAFRDDDRDSNGDHQCRRAVQRASLLPRDPPQPRRGVFGHP